MPAIRQDQALLRLTKQVNDIWSALRRVTVSLPLFDIANENTPTQLTANQNNYVPGNYDILRMNSDRTVTITGLRGGIKGRSLKICNVGANAILLAHENASSDAENRFRFQSGRVGYIGPNSNILLYYDSTNQRWISAVDIFEPTPFFVIRDISNADWTSIAYSDSLGLYAAVGQTTGTPTIATSPDAITWTSRVSPSITTWQDIIWATELGLFVAVASNAVMTSSDGINWVSSTPASGNFWNAVAWSPDLNLLAAVSSTGAGNRVMTSPDGIIWTSQVSAANNTWEDIAWSPDLGLFAAVSSDGANRIMTSPDGVVWTARVNATGANVIAWSPDLGLFTTTFHTSTDGIVWNACSINSGSNIVGIAWSEIRGYFIAVRDSVIRISYDGDIWQAIPIIPTTTAMSVTFSITENKFVIVELNGRISTFP